MSDLASSEQERLKQLESELEQAAAAFGDLGASTSPQRKNVAWTWWRPLLTILAILGCILLVGLVFRVFATVFRWAVVAGLGYLLYVWVVAPRLGLPSGARPKAEARDLDSF